MRPRRVKIEGDLFHPRVPAGAVAVTRRPSSPWGNPHPIGKPCKRCGGATHDRAEALRRYRVHLDENPELLARPRRELPGKNLACWCPLDEPCHAEILLSIVNS